MKRALAVPLVTSLVCGIAVKMANAELPPPPQAVAHAGAVSVLWAEARGPALPAKQRPKPQDVTLATTALDGVPVVVAQWPEAGGRVGAWIGALTGAAVAGGPQGAQLRSMWQGNVGAVDADAEVRARIVVSPGRVRRHQEAVGVSHCDGKSHQLFPEDFDVARRVFAPAQASADVSSAAALPVHATAPPVAWAHEWPAQGRAGFRFTGASGPARTPRDARTLVSPSALHDDDRDTWWAPGAGQLAVASFATARAAAAVPVTGFTMAAPPQTQGQWPRRVRITLGPKTQFQLDFAPVLQANRIWVDLPSAVHTNCVTIEIVAAAEGPPTGVADVQIFTALDGNKGAEFAADQLALGQTCGAALKWARGLGSPELLAKALVARLPSAPSAGQGCVLQALSALPPDRVPDPGTWMPAALPTLLPRLVAGEEQASRAAQLEAVAVWLARAGAAAARALASLTKQESGASAPVRELAARLLCEQKQPAFKAVLLLELTEGASLPLRAAAARGVNPSSEELRSLLQSSPRPNVHGDVLWILHARLRTGSNSTSAAVAAMESQIVRMAESQAADFVVRARALTLLGALASKQSNQILRSLAVADPDPVIRHLALESLSQSAGETNQAAVQATFVQALKDYDPRVRQSAARGFAARTRVNAKAHLPSLKAAYDRERWPFVVPAHLEALAATCAAESILVAALAQQELPLDAHLVALEGLIDCKLPAAHGQAVRTLKHSGAAAPLRLAAAVALYDLGGAGDADMLKQTTLGLVQEGAAEPALDEVALATLQALVKIRPHHAIPVARTLLEQTRPRLRQGGLLALGQICLPEAVTHLQAAASSADESVARGARAELSRCQMQEPR